MIDINHERYKSHHYEETIHLAGNPCIKIEKNQTTQDLEWNSVMPKRMPSTTRKFAIFLPLQHLIIPSYFLYSRTGRTL